MNKLDLVKSLGMFMFIVFALANKMPEFMGKKSLTQKNKEFNDEIASIGGKVFDVRQADNRTYMQVQPLQGPAFWLTIREAKIEIGDQISFEWSVPRQDYYSKDMRRNFSEIYVAAQLNQITRADIDLS